jgi:hypothetical protein
MYPHERSLVKQLAGKPFALIGVNSDKDREKLKEVIKEKNLNWRSFWNGEDGTMGPISTKWNVSGWPTTYLIDAKGKIRYKNLRGDKLDEAIEELMAESGVEVEISHEDEDDDKNEDDKKEKKDEDKKDKKDDDDDGK